LNDLERGNLRACRRGRDAVRWLIMTTHPLASYLHDCRSRRGTGATTAETSLYPPLEDGRTVCVTDVNKSVELGFAVCRINDKISD
jgi:hypothetical protein